MRPILAVDLTLMLMRRTIPSFLADEGWISMRRMMLPGLEKVGEGQSCEKMLVHR
jgi:hypothetical protein